MTAQMITSGETADWRTAPFRDAGFMPVDLEVQARDCGTLTVRSRVPLIDLDWNLPRALGQVASQHPDRMAIARRDPAKGGDWSGWTYAELNRSSHAIAQWLLDHPQHIGGPILVMGANSPAMAATLFGAMAAGVPSAPVSAHYALLGGDLGRLNHVLKTLKPSVLMLEDARLIAASIDKLELGEAVIITATPEAAGERAIALSEVLATPVTPAVEASINGLNPDDVAQYMMTSGSTGMPKVVPHSHRNIATNTAQGAQVTGKDYAWGGDMVGWMPWNHVAGAAMLRAVILAGGSFYCDDGKPMPGLFETSLKNLKERPTRYYVNVPTGYAMLADALEADADLRRVFFSELRVMVFGGASLNQTVCDRIQAMAVAETGHRVMLVSAYGSTETTAGFMAVYQYTDRLGMGLPMASAELKLIPQADDRYEVRVRGPQVMTGYHLDPQKTAESFDDEGFYRMGDLCRLEDANDLSAGIVFAGRLADQFKLSTGSWVFGAQMREQVLEALQPLIVDLVLCDDDRPYLGVLAWPSPAGIKAELGLEVGEAMTSGTLAKVVHERLSALNATAQGASSRIKRFAFQTTPPDPNRHEVSDKASLNRRAVIDNRKADVDALYAEVPPASVITL
jgi:feruloyl-CoA synthase